MLQGCRPSQTPDDEHCCLLYAVAATAAHAHHALMRGSLTVSATSWAMMDAIASASALALGLARTLLAPWAAHAFRHGSGLPMKPNLAAHKRPRIAQPHVMNAIGISVF